ncbi:MAG: hypothetical protein OXC44_05810 [Proteobacteria bacterium]|nr:hypothetical protein [Pseudomonadota bacterium]
MKAFTIQEKNVVYLIQCLCLGLLVILYSSCGNDERIISKDSKKEKDDVENKEQSKSENEAKSKSERKEIWNDFFQAYGKPKSKAESKVKEVVELADSKKNDNNKTSEWLDHPIYNQLLEVHNLIGKPVATHREINPGDFDKSVDFRSLQNDYEYLLAKAKAKDGEEGNFSSCIVGDKPTANVLLGLKKSDLPKGEYLFAPDGQKAVWSSKEIQTRNGMRNFLGVSAGASASVLFSSIMADLQVEYLKDSEFIGYEIYYGAKVEVENPDVRMQNIKLSPGAYKLIKNRGIEAFYDRCGKEAVIGYRTGGYARVLFKFSVAKSRQTKDFNIRSKFKATGFSIDAKGHLSINTGSIKEEEGMTLEVQGAFAGGIGETITTNLEETKKMMKKWPATVAKHAVVTKLIKMPYNKLISSVVDRSRETIENEIGLLYNQLDEMINRRNGLLKNKFFQNVSTLKLTKTKKFIKEIEGFISKLHNAINQCRKAVSMADCAYTDLILQANNFRFTEWKKSEECGTYTKSYDVVKEVCRDVQKPEKYTTKGAECGVKLYKWKELGALLRTLWSDEIKEEHYPGPCQYSNADKRTEIVEVISASYNYCSGSSGRFNRNFQDLDDKNYGDINGGLASLFGLIAFNQNVRVENKELFSPYRRVSGLLAFDPHDPFADAQHILGGITNDMIQCNSGGSDWSPSENKYRLSCGKRAAEHGVEEYNSCTKTRYKTEGVCENETTTKDKTYNNECYLPIQ